MFLFLWNLIASDCDREDRVRDFGVFSECMWDFSRESRTRGIAMIFLHLWNLIDIARFLDGITKLRFSFCLFEIWFGLPLRERRERWGDFEVVNYYEIVILHLFVFEDYWAIEEMGGCFSDVKGGQAAVGGGRRSAGNAATDSSGAGHNDAVDFYFRSHGLQGLFTQVEVHPEPRAHRILSVVFNLFFFLF